MIVEASALKVVLHDGVEIKKVAHLGRHRRAELETALELGSPPAALPTTRRRPNATAPRDCSTGAQGIERRRDREGAPRHVRSPS